MNLNAFGLMTAMKNSDEAMLTLILAHTNLVGILTLVPEVSTNGTTPLHVFFNRRITGGLLNAIRNPACTLDVNAQDNHNGETCLHVAATDGDVHHVGLFLDHGATNDVKNSEQKTPLELAIKSCQNADRRHEVVRLFFREGLEVLEHHFGHALEQAIRLDYADTARHLVQLWNANNQEYHVDHSLLHATCDIFAAERKIDLEHFLLFLVISHHVNIDEPDAEGKTVLVKAIEDQDAEQVGYLVQFGADVHQRMGDSTPFRLALRRKEDNASHEMDRYLLAGGAAPLTDENMSQELLRYACQNGDRSLVKILLSRGVCSMPLESPHVMEMLLNLLGGETKRLLADVMDSPHCSCKDNNYSVRNRGR